jgi:ribosome maturation factor RimP
MISKDKVTLLVQNAIKGTDMFITALNIKSGNCIMVFLDGDQGVSIEDCIRVSKAVESGLNRDQEDFELTVSSHGLTSPLVLPRQYTNNTGKEISVLMVNGEKHSGTIVSVSELGIVLLPLARKKQAVEPMFIEYTQIKQAKLNISFKE